jgi:hypothetical protein
MKTPIKEKHLTIHTDGQVTFTRTETGNLHIELFQQRFLDDEISRGDAIKLMKWIMKNFI